MHGDGIRKARNGREKDTKERKKWIKKGATTKNKRVARNVLVKQSFGHDLIHCNFFTKPFYVNVIKRFWEENELIIKIEKLVLSDRPRYSLGNLYHTSQVK